MAKMIPNSLVNYIQGRVGNVVFRRRGDQTIICALPSGPTRPPTEAQIRQHERFRLAAAYARHACVTPVLVAAYAPVAQERDSTIRHVAMADYLKPPVVAMIDRSAYEGQPGGVILVLAKDDGGVVSTHVTIRTPDGAVLEQGPATLADGLWSYVTTKSRPPSRPLTIEVTATDRPGNIATKTEVWP